MNNQDVKNSLVARHEILRGVVKKLKGQLLILGEVEHDDSYLLEHSDVGSVSSLSQPRELLQVAIDSFNKAIKKQEEINDRT
jgi:hypothetical protein